jgi:hypothetical protein
LSIYGKNPQGKPVYRIVWADSRTEMFEFEGKLTEVPLYEGKADGKWVMEKWLSAEQFYGTRADFERAQKLTATGMQYEPEGVYQMLSGGGIFPGEVTPSLAYLWASQINCDQANFTNAERAQALREAYELSKKQVDAQKDAVIQNAMERTNV